jgi:hypothetical protein
MFAQISNSGSFSVMNTWDPRSTADCGPHSLFLELHNATQMLTTRTHTHTMNTRMQTLRTTLVKFEITSRKCTSTKI